MAPFRRGFLYWGSLDKRRPPLVLSSDRFNLRSSYLTVVPGSTRLRPLVTRVRLEAGEGGVDRPTMLLCEHLQELHQADLAELPLGGGLSPRRMREIEGPFCFTSASRLLGPLSHSGHIAQRCWPTLVERWLLSKLPFVAVQKPA